MHTSRQPSDEITSPSFSVCWLVRTFKPCSFALDTSWSTFHGASATAGEASRYGAQAHVLQAQRTQQPDWTEVFVQVTVGYKRRLASLARRQSLEPQRQQKPQQPERNKRHQMD